MTTPTLSLSAPPTTPARTVLRRAALTVQHAVFAVFLIAALGKLHDVGAFMRGMADWTTIPKVLIPALGFTLPTLELWLATCFFLNVARPRTVAITAGLTILFTVVYFYETLHQASPPTCACIGLWEEYYSELSSGKFVLIRNAVLVMCLTGSQAVLGRRALTHA